MLHSASDSLCHFLSLIILQLNALFCRCTNDKPHNASVPRRMYLSVMLRTMEEQQDGTFQGFNFNHLIILMSETGNVNNNLKVEKNRRLSCATKMTVWPETRFGNIKNENPRVSCFILPYR